MAKKPRTPAPPKRPVQAPQRRDRRRGGSAQRNLWPIIAALVLIAAAAVAAALYFALRGDSGSSSTTTSGTTTAAGTNPLNDLPGIRKIKTPWPPEYADLADRLRPLKLQALSQEALAYHIHQQLNIFINGKRVDVPAGIGINDSAYITELHTHDPTGIVHIEAESSELHYTLGDLFAEWGIFLDSKCVGAYCQGYTWYINGKKQSDPPWQLQLKSHQVITIAVGKPPKKIPSTYDWRGL